VDLKNGPQARLALSELTQRDRSCPLRETTGLVSEHPLFRPVCGPANLHDVISPNCESGALTFEERLIRERPGGSAVARSSGMALHGTSHAGSVVLSDLSSSPTPRCSRMRFALAQSAVSQGGRLVVGPRVGVVQDIQVGSWKRPRIAGRGFCLRTT
jgi:hypothetical protein